MLVERPTYVAVVSCSSLIAFRAWTLCCCWVDEMRLLQLPRQPLHNHWVSRGTFQLVRGTRIGTAKGNLNQHFSRVEPGSPSCWAVGGQLMPKRMMKSAFYYLEIGLE